MSLKMFTKIFYLFTVLLLKLSILLTEGAWIHVYTQGQLNSTNSTIVMSCSTKKSTCLLRTQTYLLLQQANTGNSQKPMRPNI